jgi:superfamily II DNA or RNA helicase
VHSIGLSVEFEAYNIETENGVYVAAGVLVSNCHHVPAVSWSQVVKKFPAAYKIGASADERRKDGLEFLLYDSLGPCIHVITKETLVSQDHLMPVEMLLVETGYEDEQYLGCKAEGISPDWNQLLNNLTQDDDRNAVILEATLKILRDPSSRVLLLSERVEACREWKRVLESQGHPCGLMIGGTPNKDEVANSIAWLKTGKLRVAVGTKIADEGLDIPQLTHVLVTCPIHTHPHRLEQMTGRCARVCEGKSRATAVYFWDSQMFPTPNEDDDLFKIRGRKRRFFGNLKKACSKMRIWDPTTDKISDVDLMKVCT